MATGRTTVAKTATAGLCISCGICKNICPKKSISWKREDGLFLPQIDPSSCVICGICAAVCPGLGHAYESQHDALTTVTGSFLAAYNAWSKDPMVRHLSASGGIISTLTAKLLSIGTYDVAFCVDSYDYRDQLVTRPIDAATWNPDAIPKSRYVPVSHENAVAYIKENPNARVIFIGTSCAVRGFSAVLKQLKLSRENFLLIGLFCDRVFNYNIYPYLQHTQCNGNEPSAIHFKNKESGGWPGDMKFMFPDGSHIYQTGAERVKMKDYFMPERCLYCVDKLNVYADISLGDNYTGINSSALGSNSVILRTTRGKNAWNAALDSIEAVPVDIHAIQKAQYLESRLNNLYFSDLKVAKMDNGSNLNPGVVRTQSCSVFEPSWKLSLKRLKAGQVYDIDPRKLEHQLKQDRKKPNSIISFCKRGYYFFKRKLS